MTSESAHLVRERVVLVVQHHFTDARLTTLSRRYPTLELDPDERFKMGGSARMLASVKELHLQSVETINIDQTRGAVI